MIFLWRLKGVQGPERRLVGDVAKRIPRPDDVEVRSREGSGVGEIAGAVDLMGYIERRLIEVRRTKNTASGLYAFLTKSMYSSREGELEMLQEWLTGRTGQRSDLSNVQEHATPLAGASVETGVEVHFTGDVADSAASGGCCVSTCSALLLLLVPGHGNIGSVGTSGQIGWLWWIAAGLVGVLILPSRHQRVVAFMALDLVYLVPKACCIGHVLLKHLPAFIFLRLKMARCGLHLRYLLLKRFVIHKGRELRVKFLPNA